jgi:hypothetical protein
VTYTSSVDEHIEATISLLDLIHQSIYARLMSDINGIHLRHQVCRSRSTRIDLLTQARGLLGRLLIEIRTHQNICTVASQPLSYRAAYSATYGWLLVSHVFPNRQAGDRR